MNRTRPAWFLAAAACLAQQQPPTLRVTTRLIQVNVSVRDNMGAPVSNLAHDDFELFEDGKPRKIAFFESSNTQTPIALPPRAAGMATNRASAGRGAVVLLLDALNTPAYYRERSRSRVRSFAGKLVATNDLALFVLTDRLERASDFTRDAAQFAAGLERFAQFRIPDKDSLMAEQRIVEEAMPWLFDGLYAASVAHEAMLHYPIDSLTTSETLRALALGLKGVPGRKSLVWVTTTYPRDNRVTPLHRRALWELGQAGVGVYPVDARGVLSINMGMNVGLKEVAIDTGGSVIMGRELDEAAAVIALESHAAYLLSYYSAESAAGKLHRITVRVRRPRLQLRYRTGYVTQPASAPEENSVRTELLSALRAPLDSTAIGLDAWLEGSTAIVRLHGANLDLEPAADRLAGRFRAVFVQYTLDGRPLSGVQDVFEIRLPYSLLSTLHSRGHEFSKPLTLHPDAVTLRIVVRSETTGAIGSVRVGVKPAR